MEAYLTQFITAAQLVVSLPVAQTQAPAGGPSFMPLIFAALAMFLIFQIIVKRPEQAEQKKRDEQLNALSKGDQVITIGGIHGTVEGVDKGKGTVMVAIASKVSIRVNKSAIASVTPRKKGKGSADAEESEEDEAAPAASGSGKPGGKK